MKQSPRFSLTSSPSAILNKALVLLICFSFAQVVLASPASCWDRPFDNAANWGGTGLLEIPTARVLGDGEIRFGYAEADPYRWYAGGMGVFKWLEVSGSYTEVKNIPSGLGSAYGANKDKALGLKVQLLPESRRFPAIAIGWYDFHGTQLYESQYLVLSRQIFPLDFTIGIGRDRLKGLSIPFWDEVGFFGGIECALSDRFHILAEYNPIDYESDKPAARGVPDGAGGTGDLRPVALPLQCGASPQLAGLPPASTGSDGATPGLRCAQPQGRGDTNIVSGTVHGGRSGAACLRGDAGRAHWQLSVGML